MKCAKLIRNIAVIVRVCTDEHDIFHQTCLDIRLRNAAKENLRTTEAVKALTEVVALSGMLLSLHHVHHWWMSRRRVILMKIFHTAREQTTSPATILCVRIILSRQTRPRPRWCATTLPCSVRLSATQAFSLHPQREIQRKKEEGIAKVMFVSCQSQIPCGSEVAKTFKS